MGRLDGKVAVITGAASGMGQATAELFAREGCAVAVTDVDGSAVERAAQQLVESGRTAMGQRIDVTS